MKMSVLILLLSLVAGHSFAAQQTAQLHLSEEAADQLLEQLAKDPQIQITQDPQGAVVVEPKPRTKESVDPMDKKEAETDSTYQKMFNVGFAFGGVIQKRSAFDTINRNYINQHFPGGASFSFMTEASMRMPFRPLRRLVFGIDNIGRESYADNDDRTITEKTPIELQHYTYSLSKYEANPFINAEKYLFAEWDTLTFKREGHSKIISVGAYVGKSEIHTKRTYFQTPEWYNKGSYEEELVESKKFTEWGPQVRLRWLMTERGGWNGTLSTYVLFRYGSKTGSTLHAGATVHFGKRMNFKINKQK